MSDGDGKDSVNLLNEKESKQFPKRRKKSGGDEFAQAIARIAVAQICEGSGFESFQQSALDTLADVCVRYIREIGKTASNYANLANRSECNVFDVIQGLEDLGSVQGFLGASDVSHSVSGSGVVRDTIRYVSQAEEIPFAYLLPGFPVVKERKLNPSFAQAGVDPPDDHVPSWLPKFPDPETYRDLDSSNLKGSETGIDNKVQLFEEQHAKVDRPSNDIQPKLICNGEGVAVELEDAAKAQQAAESNPFLARPFQFGEKDVSLPALPARLLDETAGNHHQSRQVLENHVSSLESFLPAKEARGSQPVDRTSFLSSERSNIHFKFGNDQRSLGNQKCFPKEGVEKISIWFGDDNDTKDVKNTEQSENME